MPVWIVTGNLGGGKSLCCVGKINDYLLAGRRVATNLDIYPKNLFPWDKKKLNLVRLPDKPTVNDFQIIGKGTESLNEKNNGLIVLDECGTWFNSRTWGDKERQPLIDWLLHSRKLGWDIMFIIQDIGIIDKQVRLTLAEHTVYCRRFDRLNIPFIGPLFSLLFNDRLPLPRIHVGIVRYGNNDKAIIVDRWVYRGNALFHCYDTRQVFSDNYEKGPFSYLPPWHLYGYRRVKMNLVNYMRMTKIYWKRFRSPWAFAFGALLVFAYHLYSMPTVLAESRSLDPFQYQEAKILSYSSFPGRGLSASLKLGDKIITSDELQSKGFQLSGNGRSLVISGGGKDVQIYR